MRKDPRPSASPLPRLPQPLPLHELSPCPLPRPKARQLQAALEAPAALGSHLGQWGQGDHVRPDVGAEEGRRARAGVGSWCVEWGGQSTYRGSLLACRAHRALASTLARKPDASCGAHRPTLPRGALKTGVRKDNNNSSSHFWRFFKLPSTEFKQSPALIQSVPPRAGAEGAVNT